MRVTTEGRRTVVITPPPGSSSGESVPSLGTTAVPAPVTRPARIRVRRGIDWDRRTIDTPISVHDVLYRMPKILTRPMLPSEVVDALVVTDPEYEITRETVIEAIEWIRQYGDYRGDVPWIEKRTGWFAPRPVEEPAYRDEEFAE
jgi:hypothetical protein